jgi:hypothetical protein
MRLELTDKRPCRLLAGEARRVPQNPRSPLVGYHLGCPRCRFVCIALQHDGGLVIDEDLAAREVTFVRPLRCTRCQALIHVERGYVWTEEDAHVRPLR